MLRVENFLVACMSQFELCDNANFISNQEITLAALEDLWQKGSLQGAMWEQRLKWEVSEKDVHWLRTSVHTTGTCAS